MKTVHSAEGLDQVHREYMESRILTAQPVAIVEMLYQVALRGLDSAIRHMREGDPMARAREVTRAQEAVNELMLALDHSAGASFSKTLAALYAYVQEQTLKGHSQPSEEAFRNARSVLQTLLEGWSAAAEKLAPKEGAPNPSPAAVPEEPARPAEAVSRATDRQSEYQPELPASSRDWSC
jgi:flagellar biosynthetic protein FliS